MNSWRIILFFILATGLFSCKKRIDELSQDVFGDVKSCGDFRVYSFSSTGSIGISVYGIRDSLRISDNPKTFEVDGSDRNILKVVVREYSKNRGAFPCTSTLEFDPTASHQWDAISGNITLWIDDDNVSLGDNKFAYSLNILLEDMVFKHYRKNSQTTTLDRMEFSQVFIKKP